jgi:hypothetical protein
VPLTAGPSPGAECGGLRRIFGIGGVEPHPRRETQRDGDQGSQLGLETVGWASLRTLWIVRLLPSRSSAVVLDTPVIRVEAGKRVVTGGRMSIRPSLIDARRGRFRAHRRLRRITTTRSWSPDPQGCWWWEVSEELSVAHSSVLSRDGQTLALYA